MHVCALHKLLRMTENNVPSSPSRVEGHIVYTKEKEGMIRYKVVERENPTTRQKFYYAQIKTGTPIKLNDLCDLIEKRSTLSAGDVKNCLEALQFEIISALKNGHTVRFGDLGSFRPTLSSRSSESTEAFEQTNIKQLRVRFTPSATMSDELSLEKLELTRDDDEGDEEEEIGL